MMVSEIFYSLQGEGKLAGTPGVFVRLAGCSLRCKWCDTPYAWTDSGATRLAPNQIAAKVKEYHSKNAVITGGEPMIAARLAELLTLLRQSHKHITIETAGIAFLPHLHCDLMSISPKLSNSTPLDPALAAEHEKSRLDITSLRKLTQNYQYQLKFVVDSENDLPEIIDTIEMIKNVDPQNVMLMPQASTRNEYLSKSQMVAKMCTDTGFAFSPRLQTLLWNNQPGR